LNFEMMHLYWYLPPLVVVISLVYSASRHESWRRIWTHFLRLCTWILGILVIATALLLFINSQLDSGQAPRQLDGPPAVQQHSGVAQGTAP